MRRAHWKLFRHTLWLLLATCAAARAQDAAPFMWQVQGPHATHYLVGSIHLLPREAQELPSPLQDAYEAVDELVFETDIARLEQRQTRLGLLAAAHSPQGLQAEIGAHMYGELTRYAGKLGMPMLLCQPYKAWFCALSLEVFEYQKAGFSSEDGIDETIFHWAREDGKAIRWFEPLSVQFGLFTGMPPALARDFLAAEMDQSIGADEGDPAALLRAWRDNDTGAVERVTAGLKERYPEIYQRLYSQRNRKWLPQLVRTLEGGRPAMVVAGAAHWVGPDGLIALLGARGYKVQPYIAPESQLITRAGKPLLQAVAWRR